MLLPPGLHYIKSDTLSYKRAFDLSEQVVKLGPFTCITVDEGYSIITQDNGKQVILPGGQVHLLTHRNWKLENVMSLKVQTDQLEAIEAASADNVQMRITSTVSWCALSGRAPRPACSLRFFRKVDDVQSAARSLRRWTRGRAADPRANALKLKTDVLMQAKASLASFIGTVHYSGGVGVAAATAGAMGATPTPPPVATATGGFFDAAKIDSAMAHAEACALYGRQILSINVISAVPTDPSLIIARRGCRVDGGGAQRRDRRRGTGEGAARDGPRPERRRDGGGAECRGRGGGRGEGADCEGARRGRGGADQGNGREEGRRDSREPIGGDAGADREDGRRAA